MEGREAGEVGWLVATEGSRGRHMRVRRRSLPVGTVSRAEKHNRNNNLLLDHSLWGADFSVEMTAEFEI